MKHYLLLLIIIILNISCSTKNQSGQLNDLHEISNVKTKKNFEPVLLKEIYGLTHCESVVLDEKRNVLYVSVQGEKEPEDGTIAKVSIEGELIDTSFVTGLNNPKGMVVKNDRLFVGDMLELVEVDLTTGTIVKRYTSDSVEFLNDVTIDDKGEIYVSDMFTSSIYKLDTTGKFGLWFTAPDMENPNGLLAVGDELYVAGWGRFTDRKPKEAPQGRFLKLDKKTKAITVITPEVLGNLDGVQVYDENSFLVSDWIAGNVFKVSKTGRATLFLETPPSVGDILFLKEKELLFLPMNKQNKLMIYKTS